MRKILRVLFPKDQRKSREIMAQLQLVFKIVGLSTVDNSLTGTRLSAKTSKVLKTISLA